MVSWPLSILFLQNVFKLVHFTFLADVDILIEINIICHKIEFIQKNKYKIFLNITCHLNHPHITALLRNAIFSDPQESLKNQDSRMFSPKILSQKNREHKKDPSSFSDVPWNIER